MSLEVTVNKKQEGVYVVSCAGSIDSDTSNVLESKIGPVLNPSIKAIIFNMKELNYISSMGVGVIFRTRSFVEENNGKIIMVNLKPQIKKVFQLIKALPSEDIFESVQELDNYLSAMQKKEIERRDSF